MRVVTIGADHACMKHARLREGPPFEYFALNLAVSMVFTALHQQRRVCIKEATSGYRISNQRPGARMAWRAGFNLRSGGLARRPDPLRDATRIILSKTPSTGRAITEPNGESTGRIFMVRATLCPGNMCAPRAMAAFATNADFRPCCFITVACRDIAAP